LGGHRQYSTTGFRSSNSRKTGIGAYIRAYTRTRTRGIRIGNHWSEYFGSCSPCRISWSDAVNSYWFINAWKP
jgi:hypothetical protein